MSMVITTYNGWYILGGRSGNIYICYKQQFFQKFSALHDPDNQLACMKLVWNIKTISDSSGKQEM